MTAVAVAVALMQLQRNDSPKARCSPPNLLAAAAVWFAAVVCVFVVTSPCARPPCLRGVSLLVECALCRVSYGWIVVSGGRRERAEHQGKTS